MKSSFRWQIPAFIATKIILNTTVRMVYPFLHPFATGLGVDLRVVSQIIALRSAAGGLGPFLAQAGDRYGRKIGMLFGLLLYTAGAGTMAIYPSLISFALALVLTMLGNLVFIPSLQAYLGDHIPYERRGRAIALTELGWSLAFIAGVPLVGVLMARWGWASPFLALSAAGLFAIALLAWLLPSDRHTAQPGSNLLRNLRGILTTPAALAGLLMGLIFSLSNELVNLVFGVWLGDSFNFELAGLGATAALIGVSELFGELLSGGLVDRLGKPRSVAAGLVLNGLAAAALPLLGRTAPGALAGLVLFFITFEFTIVSSLPLMTEVMPGSRATLLAVNIAGLSIGRAFGDLLAPELYTRGMLIVGLATLGFNILALLALRSVRIGQGQLASE